jgi:glycosyltransferase involved in cell wall biosynthesis
MKKKILTLCDHPQSPSGVGLQSKIFMESLLKTGRYQIISLGGAMKHSDYSPKKVEPYGDDWIIYPVDGYGTPELIRSILRTEKPDLLWFMTDPRFWGWLWEIDSEIRAHIPMVYYHVWDNYPYPVYNKKCYDSNDVIVSISKLTHDIVTTVAPDVEAHYLPHSVESDIFEPLEQQKVDEFRNARRKQSGTLLWWFKEFLDEVGHDKSRLIMHTDPKDPYGQDLIAMLRDLKVSPDSITLSTKKIDKQILAMMYNMADCTVNISDAEGFGLSTFESLSCGTPIIVNMTGGLQEQVTDGENWFGIGIEPCSKAIIGSQDVPYIYEDRISKEDFIAALHKIHNMSKEERKSLGKSGREHVLQNYNYDNYCNKWVEIIDNACEKYGSWKNRKNYQPWSFSKVL